MISVCIASYGSSDWDSLAWSRAWPSAIAQDPHEVIVEHQALGDVASSRNAAAAKATGDWLCFLDADDELAPGYIEAMQLYSDLDSSARTLLTPRVMQVVKGRRKRPKFWKKLDITSGNWITIGTLVQRELFDEVGGFRLFAHGLEDWNLWSRCIRAGASVRQIYGAIYIAHYNYDSAHHELCRDKEEYMRQYELARQDAWG